MKHIISFFTFLLISCIAFSQYSVSPQLMDAVRDGSSYVDVNIFFENSREVSDLAQQLDKSHADFDTRVKAVTSLLKQNFELSYAKFVEQLRVVEASNSKAILSQEKFWIVNAVTARVSTEFVMKIASFDGVKYIDLDSPRYKIVDGTTVLAENTPRSVNGVEWGVRAVNAPSLWAMNYTGRGVVMLSIDTGVNPEHPAISTNYLGNNLPQSQCWFGKRNENPRDNASSSHGTHTTGTAMGLDRSTHDTIGIAYNAKWIACDPVASTNSELLTVSQFFSVYQWVLNPDGNEETTSDVPRVINNSWGYDYNLAMEFNACEVPENSILETLEVAGICSPFSAGNEGPNESTVGYPAMIAYNLVNPMSVAAVNSSNVAASFSSRGPSLCVDEESALKIKPEVSAPGVNVRSCVGFDSYNNLQGTSMACPHVSGALLLLAEAFPMASAKELKESLYYTAVDLGDEGEDNTYGRGMIDVMAAFEYLSQTYEPVHPIDEDFDLEVKLEISYDSENENGFVARCLSDVPQVKVVIFNHGEIDAGGALLHVTFGNDVLVDTVLNGLLSGGHIEYILENIPMHGGMNEILAYATPMCNAVEYDSFNNSAALRFFNYFNSEIPYSIDFESGRYVSDNKVIAENPNMKKTWKILPWGENMEHQALGYSFSENFKFRDVDYAYLPQTDLPDSDSLFLNFVYAYKRHYSNGDKDSLFVEVSTDCGKTFPYRVWSNGGPGMYTQQGDAGDYYIPTSISEFKTVSVPLSNFRGQNVMLRMKVKNEQNSELYIDELSLENHRLDAVPELAIIPEQSIAVYPNPSCGRVEICVPHEYVDKDICIYDVCGRLVSSTHVAETTFSMDLSSQKDGVYFVRLSGTYLQSKIVLLKK